MKARITKEAPDKELVLFYLIDQADGGEKMPAVLEALQLSFKIVTEDMLQESLGCLAECEGFAKETLPPQVAWGVYDLPTMIVSGLSRKKLDNLLHALQKAEIDIPLKAVVTPSNKHWSFSGLLDEIMGEQRAFAAMEREKRNHKE